MTALPKNLASLMSGYGMAAFWGRADFALVAGRMLGRDEITRSPHHFRHRADLILLLEAVHFKTIKDPTTGRPIAARGRT